MEDREDTFYRCLTQALELREDAAQIPPDADLANYGLLSLNLIRLILLLEEEFGISIRDEDLLISKFSTVRRALETLSSYIL